MDLKLGDNQYTTIHLDGLDTVQAEGMFQSAPKWVCSDNTIVKITPDEDGCRCRIEAAKPAKYGTAVVTVTDRDNSAVPAVIFNITIAKERALSLGIAIDPATEIGKLPKWTEPPKQKPTPSIEKGHPGQPEQPKP